MVLRQQAGTATDSRCFYVEVAAQLLVKLGSVFDEVIDDRCCNAGVSLAGFRAATREMQGEQESKTTEATVTASAIEDVMAQVYDGGLRRVVSRKFTRTGPTIVSPSIKMRNHQFTALAPSQA